MMAQALQSQEPARPLEIDHIIPKARGGTDAEANLWLACRMCHSFKRTPITARAPHWCHRHVGC